MADKEGKNNEWYTNKELFEMVSGLRDDLQETRKIITKYNGLRKNQGEMQDDVESLKGRLDKIERHKEGRNQITIFVREWGNWLVPIIMLLLYYIVEIA